MISGFRRLQVADRLAVLYSASYVAWLLLRTPGTPTSVAVGTVVFYPVGLAVAWANWRNARVAALDPRTRRAWMFLAFSALSLWFSGSAWTFYLAWVKPQVWPEWMGGVEFTQHLLALCGYMAFPRRRPGADRRVRFRFDISLTVVAGFVLAVLFGARGTLTREGGFGFDVFSWSVDWLLFVVASVGFLQKRDAAVRAAMGILLASNTAYILANVIYSQQPHYQSGDAVDILWFGAWQLRWAAARYAACRYRNGDTGAQAAHAERVESPYPGGFSYVMVAGAFTLLIAQVLWGDRQLLGLLAVCAMSMAGLLVLRQLTELRENRRLFAARLAQDARFRLLIQGSSDVVLVIDSGGAITYVSPSAARLYGDPCRMRVGVKLQELVAPDDREALDVIFERGRPDAPRVEVRLSMADGSNRDTEIAWNDLRDDPVVRGIVLNCRDTTERNELERQLRHAQKLDEVGLLAGGLAHDFNNVLTAIRGYSELLRVDLSNPERAREDLAHVEEAVDRAATVTRKLLSLSRNQPVQRRATDLNGICRGLRPLLRQLLTDRIEVSLDLSPDLWPVMADPGQIEQVLLNLASNARDAMPNGGRLRIATANRVVTTAGAGAANAEGAVAPGDYAAILVVDEGCGMTPEVRARIFEPFFSTKPRESGMGLGLAMVMGIVSDSGGGVLVDSRPGKGTTFTVLLPRTSQAAAVTESRAACAVPTVEAATSPTVLLVDDEVAVRTVAARMLRRQGYRVLEAASGSDAVQAASDPTQPIDLLLTDLVMPGLHGTELIARFREVRPGVPIICMTGFAGDTQDPIGVEASAAFILSKPFSSEELLRGVGDALANQG